MNPSKHPKPHFVFSGGIWQVTKDLDLFTTLPARSLTAWLDEINMADLIRTFHWWKSRDPSLARITDNMILKRCQAVQLAAPNRRFAVEHNSRFGQHDVFTAHPKSRFATRPLRATRTKVIARAKSATARQQADNYLDLIASGYCRTSNRHRIVSRIDTAQWRDELAMAQSPWDPDESHGAGYDRGAADTYRRCHTKDRITIQDEELFKKFPGSDDGPTIYMPLTVTVKEKK